MFNLETAIETWRHSLQMERSIQLGDIEELETHLRDHVEDLIDKGETEEIAFRSAVSRLGNRLDIGHAYQDNFWNKVVRQKTFKQEVRSRLAFLNHYFVIAIRSIKRQKVLVGLNLVGLSLGFAACLVIGLYVLDELSFDDIHSQASDIYRVSADWDGSPFATSAMRMGIALEQEFSEVSSYVRLYPTELLIAYQNERFELKNAFYTDSTLWNVFDFKLLRGDVSTVLSAPENVVLSETVAKRLFGDVDPMGQLVQINLNRTAVITGIIADPPTQSHIQYTAFFPIVLAEDLLPQGLWDEWFWTEGYTYVLLQKGTDAKALQDRFASFQEKVMGEASRVEESNYDLVLEPLSTIYLESRSAVPIGPTSNGDRLSLLITVALLIVFLAAFNFTNLATASSIVRTREVGIRKSVGAQSGQIRGQFLLETGTICVISFAISILVAWLSLDLFTGLTGKTLSLAPFWNVTSGSVLFGALCAVCLLAGIFPSLVLSNTQTVMALKGNFTGLGTGKRVRRTLVLIQFSIAISLISGTMVVRQQLSFVQSASLGVSIDDILVIDTSSDREIQRSTERIKQALLADPDISHVTASSDPPGSNRNSARTIIEDNHGEMAVNFSKLYFVDEDFASTYGLEFIAGRNFSKEIPSDSSSAMIVSDLAAKVFGYYPVDVAIGKRYEQWGRSGTIIGVFKTFNFTSLKDPIRPLSMRIDPTENRFLSVRIRSQNLGAAMKRIETIWMDQVPHRPLSAQFLDERLDALYTADLRFSSLVTIFSILASIIGCLGLYGLASIMAERRAKELSIRKILGASTPKVMMLLAQETTVLVGIAFVLSVPFVWIYGSRWLEQFAFRIHWPWLTVLISGILALAIAWITVAQSSFEVSRRSPADTLR